MKTPAVKKKNGVANLFFATPNVRYAKQSVRMSEPEPLHDFVRRIVAEKGLKYRQVAKRGGISTTTVSDVINQRIQSASFETLIGLARGLGVPEGEILDVARGVQARSLSKDQFYLALEAMGASVPMFDGGENVLADLTDEDLAELLDTIRETTLGAVRAKARRRQREKEQ